MKRWKTCESLAVEDFFEDITQPIRWRSVEKLEKISVDLFENISQVQQIPKEDKGVLNHSYLVCAICKQFFSTPKLLRCLHSFCKSCLESLVTNVTDTEDIVVCAICSATSKLGSQGVKALPVNFLVLSGLKHLNYAVQERKAPIMCGNCEDLAQATGRCDECAEFLCEKCTAAHRRVRVTREHEIIPLNEIRTSAEVNNNLNEPDNCLAHKGEELTYYCQTCDELICRECTVVNHPKKSHAFELLKDASTKHRQEIWSLLRSIKMRTPFVKRALLEIEEACGDIPEHANAIEEQIRNLTVRYIRALKDREAQLLDELGAMKEYKATLLEQQKDRLHKGIKDIESNCGLIEKMSREGTAVEVARVKNFISERLRNLEDKLQDMSPLEGPEFDYVTEEELLFDVINRGGKVKSSTKPPAVRLIGEGLYNATVGKTSSFVLALRQNTTITKDQIEVRIETPDLVILTCNITEHNSQLSLLTYTPKIHGQHVITVLANGENVEESPYTVYVKKGHMNFAKKSLPVCLRFGYKGCGRGELNNPSGVAVDSSGVIAVSDTLNDRVQLFSCRGAFIRQFGSTGDDVGKLRSPIGLCFSRDGQIVVADRGNNRIQVFNPEGVLVRVILCAERSLGAIKNPTGVAVDEEGQVLVTDQQNHRVVIFNSHGAYCHQFGSLGIKDGEFNNPSYITLNQDGEIFVTDTSNHRVQIFNSSGRFLRKFGRPGTADGQFHYPVGITVDSSGYVFVSDRTNRVQVFNSHLRFVTKFGGKLSGDGQLSNPQGVDYTPEGRLVVADTGNNSVKVFYFPNE